MIRHRGRSLTTRHQPAVDPRRWRRGYSLIEVLMAVAIVSMVMTAVAVAMQAMYNVDRQLKDNAAHGQVVRRLSLQLRSDAHMASDVALLDAEDEPAGVLLTLPAAGEVIEYQSNAGRVIRTRRRELEELGREVYSLGKTTTVHWRIVESPSPIVELKMVRPTGKIDSADSRQIDRVIAAIGIRVTRVEEGAADAPME